MNKILIITSGSLRHLYFANSFVKSFTESKFKIIIEGKINFPTSINNSKSGDIIEDHFISRENSEYQFFSGSDVILKQKEKILNIQKGEINNLETTKLIKDFNPELIVTYGCSIIKPKLIDLFKNKIINVHLGISPYYRGAGTNFHALVNNEFHFFGYTIMYIDKGIDTGEIIHQGRAEFINDDTPHTIGNRLIKKMTKDFISLISNFTLIEHKPKIKVNYDCKLFMIRDADKNATKNLYKNFSNNLMSYIACKDYIEKKFPIIKQKFV